MVVRIPDSSAVNRPFDPTFVRAQFPAFDEPALQGQAHFENAGGSYACRQVIDRLGEYYRRLRVQPYYPSQPSAEAGAWMDASYLRLAEYLNVPQESVHFGPSTSQNTYVLARAFRPLLQPGDEVVLTDQDHEANHGVWRQLGEVGAHIRQWTVQPDSGALDPAALDRLLTGRTRLLVFPHCSNIIGQINPVAAITARARAAGVLTVVDGVSAAPHGLPDVAALGADIYLFSLYKTFGPHLGLMTVAPALLQRLANQGHDFNAGIARKRLLPAGPDHAQIAAARGVAEYFDALDAHHGGGDTATRPARVRNLLQQAESPLLERLLSALRERRDLRLIGPAKADGRAPTVSLLPLRATPMMAAQRLARSGIMAGAGHFYAVRLLQAMGIDPARGVLRLSMAHYNSADEVDRLLNALEPALAED